VIDRLQGIASLARLAWTTRSPLRFLVRQARRDRRPAAYRLRGSGLTIHLRHATPDLHTLEEIFRLGHYSPPPEAQAALQARRPLRVVDLGANIGAFGALIIGLRPDARVVALEPDPANAAVHRMSVEAYRGPGSWELVEACAATQDGEVAFAGGRFATSRVASDSESTLRVPARDAYRWLAEADLVKMDIEGGEWEILRDKRLGSIGAACLAVEYHPELCPGEEPGAEAARSLMEAGFSCREVEFPLPERHGMIWAWKGP
jgi:FkbM family methyltransferase